MAINYPIIETQIRLIRALQKGYVEALEAGDWQAADYRCNHLRLLCEGLYHLSQLLDKEDSLPEAIAAKNANSWVNTIRSMTSTNTQTQSFHPTDQSAASTSSTQDPTHYIWSGSSQSSSLPVDEVWQ